MNDHFHIHAIEAKKDIAMEYAEFIIGVNDDELEDPNNPSQVNITALLTEFLEQRLRHGDMRLGARLESVHWYEYGYSSNKNTARRGIKVTCNLGDSDWGGPCVDHESYYRLWRETVLEVVKSLMIYLSQTKVKVYFRGDRKEITIVDKSYY